jgi:hypothetical protein
MNNQIVERLLAKNIRQEDGFIVRAAKCAGIHMENNESFDSEVGFKMRTVTRSSDGEYDSTALLVKTDAFEYLDVLFKTFIDNVVPFHPGGEEDLQHLCSVYEREKANGVEIGYVEVTFFLNADSSEIKLKTSRGLEITVSELEWTGQLFK